MRSTLAKIAPPAGLLVACLVLLGLCVLDYSALHDIWWDYASRNVLVRFDVDSRRLPWWTEAVQEWDLVTASLYTRAVMLLLLTIASSVRLRRVLRETPGRERPQRPP